MHLSNFLRENNIILVSLIPNATHIIQPLDVAVFKPLKQPWKEIVNEWLIENENKSLTRQHVAPLLKKVVENRVTLTTIKNGFRRCGIFPFNPDNVDYSKCIKMSKPETIKNTDASTVDSNQESTTQHLKFLEKCIGDRTMEEFKSYYPSEEWNGAERKGDLYIVWFQIRKQIKNLSDLNNKENLRLDENVEEQINNMAESGPLFSDGTRSDEYENLNQSETANENVMITPNKVQATTSFERSEIEDLYFSPSKTFADIPVTLIETPTANSSSPDKSLFSKVLFWPSASCSNTRKGKIKQKVPSVVTFDLWKNYHNVKENHKQKQKEQVELRRLQREERKKAQKEKNEKKIKKGKQTKSKKDANKTDTRQEYKCYKCQSEWY
jgi:hypothetical protein